MILYDSLVIIINLTNTQVEKCTYRITIKWKYGYYLISLNHNQQNLNYLKNFAKSIVNNHCIIIYVKITIANFANWIVSVHVSLKYYSTRNFSSSTLFDIYICIWIQFKSAIVDIVRISMWIIDNVCSIDSSILNLNVIIMWHVSSLISRIIPGTIMLTVFVSQFVSLCTYRLDAHECINKILFHDSNVCVILHA